MYNYDQADHEEDDDEEINEEQIVQAILELGNDILANIGVEEKIDDVGVFFSDTFYIQFFQAAFPEIDFSQLEEATNEEEMAENIQALIDLLGSQILKYDLSHISGKEIVSGNPEHCINLLQLVQEISLMMENKEDGSGAGGIANQLNQEDDDDEEDGSQAMGSHQKQRQEEDDEAQIIHERQRRAQQESASKQNSRLVEQIAPSAQKNQSSQKRGRSYSDDRGKPAFEMPGFDDDEGDGDQLEMEGDDDDEEEEEMRMMQEHLKQQQLMQQQQQHHDQFDDDDELDGEEYDEDDADLYNQLLANQQQQQQQHSHGKAPPPQQMHQQEEDEDDEDQEEDSQFRPSQQQQMDEYEEDEEEDNMEDLDPELVQAAQQMGLNPAQIRQLQQQLQSQGYGEEEAEDMESYYSEGEMQTRIKLLKQKSYSAPYILISDCYDEPLYDQESQTQLQKACSTTMLQSLELKEDSQDQGEDGDEEEMDEKTLKLLQQQQQQMLQQQQKEQNKAKEAYAQQQQKAQSLNQSKQSSNKKGHQQLKQHVIDDEEDEDDDGIDINMAEQLKKLQEQQIQQQQHRDFDQEEDYGEEEEEEYDEEQLQQQMMMQQMQQHQQQQQQQQQEYNGQDEEEEEDDDNTMIELDDLDEHEKEQLLQYLQQEYEKNPDGFPIPMDKLPPNFRLNIGNQKEESIRDIKSEEMIVEDAQRQQQYQDDEEEDEEDDHQIMGGEQEVEDDQEGENDDDEQVELTEEQQLQLQQLLLMQQQQMEQENDEEYGDEDGQVMMNQPRMQAYVKPKKGKKKSASRPKSAGKKRYNQNENMNPNIQYQQQMIMAQSHGAGNFGRPPKQTVKKRPSTSKPKRTVGVTSHPKLQPYAMPKLNTKVLQPSTRSQLSTLTKKKKKKSAKKPTRQQMQMQDQEFVPLDFQVLSEEVINSLTPEQMQALVEHQQQLIMMKQHQQMQQQQQMHMQQQQNPPIKKALSRPRSGKKTVPKMTVSTRGQIYGQPYGQQPLQRKRSLTNTKAKKKKTKRPAKQVLQQQNGVYLNNFFPALEGQMMMGGGPTDGSEASLTAKDQKYPKFGNENINNQGYMDLENDQIDEVPAEQEEGESQEHFKHNFYPQMLNGQHLDPEQIQMLQQQMQMQEEEGQDDDEGEGDDQEQQETDQNEDQEQIELTEEQLAQLVQNAHNLPPEQQLQLQLILQEKMREADQMSGRAQSYENIYSILMDNVKRAKDRLAHLGETDVRRDGEEETDRRILKQKMELDALYKDYVHTNKVKNNMSANEEAKMQKQFVREHKINTIKERKFEEDLVNQQKSLMYKRNAQQVRLCQKVYKLASDLEKNKLLQEKKEFKETQFKKKAQKKMMIDAIETYYKDRITMLKDRIHNERFERKIAQQAQTQALARMKRELNGQKKQEINKYLQLLKQEDQKYDFESTNMAKIENEIIKLYKK